MYSSEASRFRPYVSISGTSGSSISASNGRITLSGSAGDTGFYVLGSASARIVITEYSSDCSIYITGGSGTTSATKIDIDWTYSWSGSASGGDDYRFEFTVYGTSYSYNDNRRPGSYINYVISTSSSSYPSNDMSGSYWYIRR